MKKSKLKPGTFVDVHISSEVKIVCDYLRSCDNTTNRMNYEGNAYEPIGLGYDNNITYLSNYKSTDRPYIVISLDEFLKLVEESDTQLINYPIY